MRIETVLIELSILIIPVIIPFLVALIRSVPARLKCFRYIRNLGICLLLAIAILKIPQFIQSMHPHNGHAFVEVACDCRSRIPVYVVFIFSALFFLLLEGICRFQKFKFFKNWIVGILSVVVIAFVVAHVPFLSLRHCCNEATTNALLLLGLIDITLVSHIIYKKALGKQSKK